MSWKAAADLARDRANRLQRGGLTTQQRVRELEHELAQLDRDALGQWLNHRLGEELRAFEAVLRLNAKSEDVTQPDVPWKRR